VRQALRVVGTGSDAVAHAGRQAKVVVDITGEDDETMQHIELLLRLNLDQTWPLAELPATLGRHEVTVEMPTPLRSRGTAVEVLAPVDVVSRPEDLFWPDRPRARSDWPGVSIQLDAETVDMGASITGRVLAAAGQRLTVEVGPVLDRVHQVEGSEKQARTVTFESVARVELKEPGTFSLEIPAEQPPTLQNTATSVVWRSGPRRTGWRPRTSSECSIRTVSAPFAAAATRSRDARRHAVAVDHLQVGLTRELRQLLDRAASRHQERRDVCPHSWSAMRCGGSRPSRKRVAAGRFRRRGVEIISAV
jgi:hypothetical protein